MYYNNNSTIIQLKYNRVVGIYTGNDEESRLISLPFTPICVISAYNGYYFVVNSDRGGITIQGYPLNPNTPVIEIVNNGFMAYNTNDGDANIINHSYRYIAFQ